MTLYAHKANVKRLQTYRVERTFIVCNIFFTSLKIIESLDYVQMHVIDKIDKHVCEREEEDRFFFWLL